jgi:hypothetical protein
MQKFEETEAYKSIDSMLKACFSDIFGVSFNIYIKTIYKDER